MKKPVWLIKLLHFWVKFIGGIEGDASYFYEKVPCADGFHHTEFTIFCSGTTKEAEAYPSSNFDLISEKDKELIRDFVTKLGFKLKQQSK